MDLIDRLRQIQGDNTDESMAQSIGVSRQTWNGLKNRKKEPDRHTLALIWRSYPDLKDSIGEYVLRG